MLPRAVRELVAYTPGTGFYADGQGGGELADGPLKRALEADFGSVDGESRFVAYRRSSPLSRCVSVGLLRRA